MSWNDLKNAHLRNDLVELRRITVQDRDAFREIAFHPDIWTHFVARVDSEDSLDRFLETAIRDTLNGTRIVFSIRDLRTGGLVGSSAYGNISEAERKLEIGWSWITPAAQRGGANRAAKQALLAHAFDVLGCERVEFKTDVLNTKARTALRDIGATEEAVLRSFNYMPDGRRRDAIFYSILKHEWPAVADRLKVSEIR
jgi:RimJ/RimL family protein N-acetyltransferase